MAFLLTLPVALLVAVITLVGDAAAAVVGRACAVWSGRRPGRMEAHSAAGPAAAQIAAVRDNTRASIIIVNWNGR